MQEYETYKEVLLRRITYAVDTVIDRMAPQIITGSVHEEVTSQTEAMVITLTRNVWTEQKPEKVFTYPDGWIEAVKERWAPGWVKKRYHVKVKSVTVTCDIIYPGLVASLPKERSVVKMRIMEGKGYL